MTILALAAFFSNCNKENNFKSKPNLPIRNENDSKKHQLDDNSSLSGNNNEYKYFEIESNNVSDNLFLDNRNVKGVLVCDWDNCFASYHMWAEHRNKSLDHIKITETTFGDYVFFKNVLPTILKEKQIGFAIASFGRKDVILKALKYLYGENVVGNIFIVNPGTFDDFSDGQDMGTKNKHLELISSHFEIDYSKILFIDDTEKNLNKCPKECKTIYAKPLTRNDKGKIIDNINNILHLNDGK